jgi:hypothetical protein
MYLNLVLTVPIYIYTVTGRQGRYILQTVGSQMAGRLSPLSADRALPPRKSLVLIPDRAIVRLEVLGKLKDQMTSSGIDPAVCSNCLNQLR